VKAEAIGGIKKRRGGIVIVKYNVVQKKHDGMTDPSNEKTQ
jgi:hypothetical protein